MISEPVNDRLLEVESALVALGQETLLEALRLAGPAAYGDVLGQLSEVDWAGVSDAVALARMGVQADSGPRGVLKPGSIVEAEPTEREDLHAEGLAALQAGRVAALVVAGGMGTRLGFDGPKGALPIGPVSERTLFGHHAAQIRGWSEATGSQIPWLVMTSPRTEAMTRAHFDAAGFFGLDAANVHFFSQHQLPAIDFDGNLMRSTPHEPALSPDGHGGLFSALATTDLLDRLAARGIETVSYFQVDNPLLPVIDPVAIALHRRARVDWSAKVIRKETPAEKLGAWVQHGDSGARIVEYTELNPSERSQRTPSGDLVLSAGSIGAHLFDLAWLREFVREGHALPIHLSPKVIPSVDSGPQSSPDTQPNGFKLERFVFDALPFVSRAQAIRVSRRDEYSPVKNAAGDYSPAAARAALADRNRRWLEAAGAKVPPNTIVELNPAHFPDPAHLLNGAPLTASDVPPGVLMVGGNPR